MKKKNKEKESNEDKKLKVEDFNFVLYTMNAATRVTGGKKMSKTFNEFIFQLRDLLERHIKK